MKKKTIVMVRGIQGSGKSTWAKNWVNESPSNRVRFNNDDIRIMLNNQENYSTFSKEREKLVAALKWACLDKAMALGYDIVMDNMNLNENEYAGISERVEEFNRAHSDYSYEIEIKDFFIPVEECIARDAQRPNPIGEKVIKSTFRRYRDLIIGDSIKNMLDKAPEHIDGVPDCIIADMDATICYNVTKRPFFGPGAAEGMMNDIPNEPVITVIRNFLNASSENEVWIVTGRECTEDVRKATETYVHNVLGNNENIHILMRNLGDNRPGEVVKAELYHDVIKGKYNVQFVLDDSSKIVKMYRSLGLTVLQPNSGNF